MVVILCERCGRVSEGNRCDTCAPEPEVAEGRAREVKRRHALAVRAAAEPPVDVPQRSKKVRPLDARWWVTSNRALPHLFVAGTDVAHSLCRTMTMTEQARPAAYGLRGCQRCALAAGWITNLGQAVTT